MNRIICLILFLLNFIHTAQANMNVKEIECVSGRMRNKINLIVDFNQKTFRYISRYDDEIIPLKGIGHDQRGLIVYALREEEKNNILAQVIFPKIENLEANENYDDVYLFLSRYIEVNGARVISMVEGFVCNTF